MIYEKMKALKVRDQIFVYQYVKDFAARRAAEAAGYAPDSGYQLLKREDIAAALAEIIEMNMKDMDINAQWVLTELVDNHRISRQRGNISASNTALKTIMTHVSVDAVAKLKVDMHVDVGEAMLERIRAGRARLNTKDKLSWL